MAEKMEAEEMKHMMDEAAKSADVALRQMSQRDSIPVARWFLAHYLQAGHKRLGRVLVAFAKETKNIRPEDYV